MPLYSTVERGDTVVAIWKITETAGELSALLADESLVVAALRFGGEQRRREWLATRLLLRDFAGTAAVEYSEQGRPFVPDGPNISVSHTKGYAAVAVSPSREQGVDIECRRRVSEAVVSRFLSAEELAAISPSRRNDALLVCWSVKEALFKIVGNLGGTFKDNIFVRPFEAGSEGTLSLSLRGLAVQGAFSAYYRIFDDFVLTLCCRD